MHRYESKTKQNRVVVKQLSARSWRLAAIDAEIHIPWRFALSQIDDPIENKALGMSTKR